MSGVNGMLVDSHDGTYSSWYLDGLELLENIIWNMEIIY